MDQFTGSGHIGFNIGLTDRPLLPVVVALGVQAFIAAQLGIRLGNRISERYREAAERIAGVALILLGAYLVAQRLLT